MNNNEKPESVLPMSHQVEIAEGERFEFGANWRQFLRVLNEERIEQAEKSLREMLESENLSGRRFLDAGSGSGLFSLAARRLGAEVVSLDYDPQSVACTRELKSRYYADDTAWSVVEGSVLDKSFIESLGSFDIVYSWGVLHHTGSMWEAIENVAERVRHGGMLMVSIYNDQGKISGRWTALKRAYVRSPKPLRSLIVWLALVRIWGPTFFRDLLRYGNPLYTWREYGRGPRGMSPWHDLIDWVGGYPFEVAKPEEIFGFLRERGFELRRLKTCGGGKGCNEFLLQKRA